MVRRNFNEILPNLDVWARGWDGTANGVTDAGRYGLSAEVWSLVRRVHARRGHAQLANVRF